jgi:methionyl-tRNA formyltransferase
MPASPRIVMLGTGDFAVPTFEALCAAPGLTVVGLVTQPDRPQGRKQELIPSQIKRSAESRGVPVLQPENVNADDGVASIRTLAPDFLVTAAYGQILSAELLGVPSVAAVNLHGSVLPSYRGAAPVARAIERGETEAGVTVIRMTPRIDAGGMLKIARTPIADDETAGELEARLAVLGAPLVVETLHDLLAGRSVVLPQEKSKVTRAPKLRKENGLIDWSKPARAVHNLVRAMQPRPAAYSYLESSRGPESEPVRVIIHKTRPVETSTVGTHAPGTVLEAQGDRIVVAAGEGAVQLLNVQMVGKKALPAAEFLRGHAALLLGRSFLAGDRKVS